MKNSQNPKVLTSNHANRHARLFRIRNDAQFHRCPRRTKRRQIVQAAQSAAHETTMNDQTDLAVTVYNSNIALVRDTREVTLPSGDFQLRFMDIASTVNPATVHFRSLAEPEKLSVLEQNYEYDLLDANKVLDKYVGREVTLMRAVQKNGSTEWEETKATLLANNNGAPVWKIGNDIVTGMSAGSYRFSSLPDNLYSRPTLCLDVEQHRRAPTENRSILSRQ